MVWYHLVLQLRGQLIYQGKVYLSLCCELCDLMHLIRITFQRYIPSRVIIVWIYIHPVICLMDIITHSYNFRLVFLAHSCIFSIFITQSCILYRLIIFIIILVRGYVLVSTIVLNMSIYVNRLGAVMS